MSNIHYHLFEIKSRIIYLIFSTIVTFFILYYYKIEIVYIIGRPFVELQQTFIFLDLTEAFYTLLKISATLTFLLLTPYIMYHIWSFFIPSRYQVERANLSLFFLVFFCLWTSEFLVTYFIILPKICGFLLSFEMGIPSHFNLDLGFPNLVPNSELVRSLEFLKAQPLIKIEFTARIESYVKLIVDISSILFLLFQIPLCVCLLYYKKMVHVSIFYKNRKILSLLSLFISAFLVPPDLLTQLTVAFLFYFVFEILIFLGLFFEE